MRRKGGRRLASAVLALAVFVGLAAVDVPPANADVLATIGTVKTIVSTVQQAYSLFDQYILGNRPPSQLEQIDALIPVRAPARCRGR